MASTPLVLLGGLGEVVGPEQRPGPVAARQRHRRVRVREVPAELLDAELREQLGEDLRGLEDRGVFFCGYGSSPHGQIVLIRQQVPALVDAVMARGASAPT